MVCSIDSNADEKLSMAEMMAIFYPNLSRPVIFKICGRHAGSAAGEARKIGSGLSVDEIDALFHSLDEDNDMVLTMNELKKGFGAIKGGKDLWKKWHDAAMQLDVQDTSKFTFDEFVQLMTLFDITSDHFIDCHAANA